MDGKLSDKEWVEKGNQHKEKGQLSEALRCFQTAINVNSKNPVAWFMKGSVMQAQEKFNNALYCYDEALILDPSLKEAEEKRNKLILLMGEQDIKPKEREWKDGILLEIESTDLFRLMGIFFIFSAALSLIIFIFSFVVGIGNWISLVTCVLSIISGIAWYAIAAKFDAIVQYFKKFVPAKE